jgi:uncharacterized protein HemX
MDTSLDQSQQKQEVALSPVTTPTAPVASFHTKKNLYPFVRHILLTILVILGVTLTLFLMQQNGKSIYENGI